jgi:hypothetical protein
MIHEYALPKTQKTNKQKNKRKKKKKEAYGPHRSPEKLWPI